MNPHDPNPIPSSEFVDEDFLEDLQADYNSCLARMMVLENFMSSLDVSTDEFAFQKTAAKLLLEMYREMAEDNKSLLLEFKPELTVEGINIDEAKRMAADGFLIEEVLADVEEAVEDKHIVFGDSIKLRVGYQDDAWWFDLGSLMGKFICQYVDSAAEMWLLENYLSKQVQGINLDELKKMNVEAASEIYAVLKRLVSKRVSSEMFYETVRNRWVSE